MIIVSIRPYIFSADSIAGNNHLLVYLHVFVWCNSAGNFCFPSQEMDLCHQLRLPADSRTLRDHWTPRIYLHAREPRPVGRLREVNKL